MTTSFTILEICEETNFSAFFYNYPGLKLIIIINWKTLKSTDIKITVYMFSFHLGQKHKLFLKKKGGGELTHHAQIVKHF